MDNWWTSDVCVCCVFAFLQLSWDDYQTRANKPAGGMRPFLFFPLIPVEKAQLNLALRQCPNPKGGIFLFTTFKVKESRWLITSVFLGVPPLSRM